MNKEEILEYLRNGKPILNDGEGISGEYVPISDFYKYINDSVFAAEALAINPGLIHLFPESTINSDNEDGNILEEQGEVLNTDSIVEKQPEGHLNDNTNTNLDLESMENNVKSVEHETEEMLNKIERYREVLEKYNDAKKQCEDLAKEFERISNH